MRNPSLGPSLGSTHYQILRLISAGGPTTRAVLVQMTGLSKAAISGFTRDLLDSGLLRETDTVQKQGRPSMLLDLASEAAFFVGFSVMTDPARLMLVNLEGQVLAQLEMPRSSDPQQLAVALAENLPKLCAIGEITPQALTAIGVSLSGLIDSKQAVCVRSTQLGWRNVPLAQMISDATGLPCYIENDAKALAVSRKLFGEARDLHSYTLIWIGNGIGAAHFVHDRLYRGSHGGAGEIAHMTIDTGGNPCRCGKIGCLDTVASMIAIREAMAAEGIAADTLADVERIAASGSQVAIRTLHRAGSALGLAIAQIIQLNDPQLVLVTHQEQAFSGLFSTVMHQTIEANVLPSLSGETPIRLRRLTEDDWAASAAAVATHNFLNGSI
ncbi:ROK family transcriptional regulator [Ketogulonicigenium vulgare]|uniref:Transcriptional regulator protein n=1 Tax=Ketogulonicigenium vulgare (strain WSH-001) TaxID=759362 RepID=F9Y5L1_KETVW|nr:ROK family transcriptional regulator [Ketogulonicigenium vulgare]ADO42569.1 transcriptional regulator protein [Ketogulonicigenium vulgare Y25]AEM40764.1 Transcriptional regulator protein [Ketogulonicigenium vulgare WSH-001]ALJ80933.1 transcriptional regulator [Ketogulonicigenium vulgare]ANW33704.1 transcriptional regulator [Ketogulonicigenium vulgare]AOZ54482.1 transcriptional regulator protein [Ketogulonicigenium vulgare]